MPGFQSPAGLYILADADFPANRPFSADFGRFLPLDQIQARTARNTRLVRSPEARSAGAPDPPENGRIVTYAGVGSYMLWRSPRAPVALKGWLEHFTPQQLSDHSGK